MIKSWSRLTKSWNRSGFHSKVRWRSPWGKTCPNWRNYWLFWTQLTCHPIYVRIIRHYQFKFCLLNSKRNFTTFFIHHHQRYSGNCKNRLDLMFFKLKMYLFHVSAERRLKTGILLWAHTKMASNTSKIYWAAHRGAFRRLLSAWRILCSFSQVWVSAIFLFLNNWKFCIKTLDKTVLW